MISSSMMQLGKKRSVIREIFEYSRKRKAEIGAENVFDFSIGNPSVPAPDAVGAILRRLTEETDPVLLHGYTSAQGDLSVRRAIADAIGRQSGKAENADFVYMTCGAAASLTISLTAIVSSSDDEVIAVAPFFPEYRVFVEKTGARFVPVMSRAGDFGLDIDNIAAAITKNTKAIIINSPCNPTGVIFPREDLEKLATLLEVKERELGTEIFLLADEPYRALAYDGIEVPYIPAIYKRTIVCYSYSKALSLPGDRIGYIYVNPEMDGAGDVYAAVCGAGRALGFVCAPSLFQFLIKECTDMTSDFSVYEKNRKLFYESLCKIGYEVVHPDGAFYLFMKSPEADANAFAARAREFELLLVPSDDFGCPGYVRIAYCVTTEQIERSLGAFEALHKTYEG